MELEITIKWKYKEYVDMKYHKKNKKNIKYEIQCYMQKLKNFKTYWISEHIVYVIQNKKKFKTYSMCFKK